MFSLSWLVFMLLDKLDELVIFRIVLFWATKLLLFISHRFWHSVDRILKDLRISLIHSNSIMKIENTKKMYHDESSFFVYIVDLSPSLLLLLFRQSVMVATFSRLSYWRFLNSRFCIAVATKPPPLMVVGLWEVRVACNGIQWCVVYQASRMNDLSEFHSNLKLFENDFTKCSSNFRT